MRLERGNLPRHHRAGDAQLLRHRRKAAKFGHTNEEMHGIKAIHCCNSSNSNLHIVGYFDPNNRPKVHP